jgi:hypothetical protein
LVEARARLAQPEPEATHDLSDVAPLLWLLWNHLGSSSSVGQPIRKYLGMGRFESMSDAQIGAANQYRALLPESSRTTLAQPEPEGVTDEELLELMPETMRDEFAAVSDVYSTATGGQVKPGLFRVVLNTVALEYARAVLAHCARPTIEPVPVSWAELTDQQVMEIAPVAIPSLTSEEADAYCAGFRRCAEAVTFTIKPVPVAERLPEPEDCDAEGRCWWWIVDQPGELPHWIYCQLEVLSWTNFTAWLPHYALPVPGAETP